MNYWRASCQGPLFFPPSLSFFVVWAITVNGGTERAGRQADWPERGVAGRRVVVYCLRRGSLKVFVPQFMITNFLLLLVALVVAGVLFFH